MTKFTWGGMENKEVFLDDVFVRSCALNIRQRVAALASALAAEGKNDKAIKVLDKCLEVTPEENVPYDGTIFSIAIAYYQAGADKKGNELSTKLFDNFEKNMTYYGSFKGRDRTAFGPDIDRTQEIMERLIYFTDMFKQAELSKQLEARYLKILQAYGLSPKMGGE